MLQIILNYLQNCLMKTLNVNHVLYYHWSLTKMIVKYFTFYLLKSFRVVLIY